MLPLTLTFDVLNRKSTHQLLLSRQFSTAFVSQLGAVRDRQTAGKLVIRNAAH